MKIAFHFWADCKGELTSFYGMGMFKIFYPIFARHSTPEEHTNIFHGDLLHRSHAYERTSGDEDSYTESFNIERYEKLIRMWLDDGFGSATYLDAVEFDRIHEENVAVIYLDSLSKKAAEKIHEELLAFKSYFGCVEVNEINPSHWSLYNASLIHFALYSNQGIYGIWDGDSEESKESSKDYLEIAKNGGYKVHGWYSTRYGRSIFDRFHDYQTAKRTAVFSEIGTNILSGIPDEVVSKLQPKCPDIRNRLFAIAENFSGAETDEQYSQIACSCRRLIEYVADCLFPPVDNPQVEGRRLGRTHYKNRILAYCDEARRSDASIDLICASTDLLAGQADKLMDLHNKGVHGAIFRAEARRCFVRTLLLLDDICSLRATPLDYGDDHLDLSVLGL